MTAEKLWLQGNRYSGNRIGFAVIRYGNVIGSRGSIIDFVNNLKSKGQKIPVTDPSMTRFWITLPNVAHFIINIIGKMKSGSIYIPKMMSCTLGDFLMTATNTTEDDWEIIGFRPGEKKHECMFNVEENKKIHRSAQYYTICPNRDNKEVPYELFSDTKNPYYTKDKNIIRQTIEKGY
jgi:UDP-N-acetylglucosamine 4,6-dehydratase